MLLWPHSILCTYDVRHLLDQRHSNDWGESWTLTLLHWTSSVWGRDLIFGVNVGGAWMNRCERKVVVREHEHGKKYTGEKKNWPSSWFTKACDVCSSCRRVLLLFAQNLPSHVNENKTPNSNLVHWLRKQVKHHVLSYLRDVYVVCRSPPLYSLCVGLCKHLLCYGNYQN